MDYLLQSLPPDEDSLILNRLTNHSVYEAPLMSGSADSSLSMVHHGKFKTRGVPQGSPTSPLLSTLSLHGSLLSSDVEESSYGGRATEILMYADDGLFYGDLDGFHLEHTLSMSLQDINFNYEKSG